MVESPPPVSSNRVPKLARALEASVLTLCAIAFLATQLAYPGALDFSIAAQIVPDLIAICGIVLCAWLAWRGTSDGALVVGILAVWISTYWIGQAHQHDSKTVKTLVFSTAGDSVRGAEFFVNGVDLGPSPVRISKDDFERRVPRLDQPPPGFAEKVYIPFYNTQWWENCWEREYVHGFGWEFPDMGKGKLYYQAQYAGEMGAAPGSGSGGGEGQVSIGFRFPQRERRLQLLLSKARLADYHVSADWFRALETFDEDGWSALRKAAQGEPGMDDVLSEWAKRKYNLDTVHNSTDAWKALMRVCREADKEHVHLTPSVGGRAVEILAKQLDPDQLVREGGRVIAQTRGGVFVQWRLAGQMQFGTADITDKLSFLGMNQDGTDGSNQPTYTGTGGAYGMMLSPGGLVIAQSLVEMWKAGIGHQQIQSEIGPDLLAWHYDSTLTFPLVLAANIGGPEVDEFLLAQPWQRNVTFRDQGMTVFGANGSDEINRWLYLLTWLNDEAGQKFHREHAPEIREMAGKLLDGGMFMWDSNHLDFLLQDHDFAWGLWPQFRAAIKKRESDPWEVIRLEYTYLEKMNAPVSAFIDLWKEERPGPQEADQAFGVLRFETPTERARPIAAGLLNFFQRDPHAMDQIPEENRKYLMAALRKTVNPEEAFMADVNAYVPADPHWPLTREFWRHKYEAIWLGGPGGLSPVVEQLANAPEPALRLLSLSAIRGTPVASNRKSLQKLLSDPDATVQSEARTVDAELQALAAQPVDELTSAGHATVPP